MTLDVATRTTAYKCPSCDDTFEEQPEPNPTYTCGRCYQQFTREDSPNGNHQCECGSFAAKESEDTCEQCGDQIDGYEEIEAFEAGGLVFVLEEQ